MCGIAGIVTRTPFERGEGEALVSPMTEALSHRGPDDRASWAADFVALGHTRLSIIDLSSRGRQPMADPGGRFQIIYNGEIYNYIELRDTLENLGHVFQTATDTEVLLHAYMQWGEQALNRLNGMWALAIWDAERRELFAARDRSGKKPFYYACTEGRLYFASEVKALHAVGLRFGVNAQAAFDFLTQGTYGHLHGQTFFSGVFQLPAAHSMVVRPGERPTPRRYWDLPVVAARDRVPYDAQFRRRFRDLLTDAVRVRMRSDVPVGATLSGGLDSSTIVLLVDEVTGGAPLHLFTSLYPGSGYDETPYFEAVTANLRAPIVHRAPAPDGGLSERLPHVLRHQEEPFGDTSIFAHYHLMERARAERVPVILSGQGGDELLLGYPSMVNAYLGHLLANGQWRRAAAEVRAWAKSRGVPIRDAFMSAALHALPLGLRDPLRARYVDRRLSGIVTSELRLRATLRRFADEPGRSMLDSYIAQVFKRFSIPHLTHYDDRNGMAFAVEGRMPFLDHRVIELLFTVEYDALFEGGFTKRALREAFSDILPPIVRQRRDKIGFYSPLARWLRSEMPWLQAYMSRDRLHASGALDADRYLRRVRELASGDDRAELEVWRGLIFHLWLEQFDVEPLGANESLGRGAPRSASTVAARAS